MPDPHQLEHEFTLQGAVARYDELRARDALAPPRWLPEEADDPLPGGAPLSREDALDLLALSEVIIRKAGYGRQLAVRTARAAGASWSQIGSALGTTKQSAWEAHARWIDDQVEQRREHDYEGMDADDAQAARTLAGRPD